MKRILFRGIMVSIALIVVAALSFAADSGTDRKAPPKGALVDINSATDAELKSIPGIGDAYITKIVAGRPYANKTQLKSRGILPGTVYEKVKDQIIARQPKKEGKTKAKPGTISEKNPGKSASPQ